MTNKSDKINELKSKILDLEKELMYNKNSKLLNQTKEKFEKNINDSQKNDDDNHININNDNNNEPNNNINFNNEENNKFNKNENKKLKNNIINLKGDRYKNNHNEFQE